MATSLVSQYDRIAFPAGSASLQQFQFVTLTASGQIVTPTSGVFAVVLDDAPSIAATPMGANDLPGVGGYTVGAFYTCVLKGLQKVIAGATLAPGVPVMSDGSGHAITATGAGNVILGWTTEAHVSGDLAPILLDRALHN
jgi:hypothetical protein